MKNINDILKQIPPEGQDDPIIQLLVNFIQEQAVIISELRAEIARLKGNPTKPKLQPSKVFELENSDQKISRSKKKRLKKLQSTYMKK